MSPTRRPARSENATLTTATARNAAYNGTVAAGAKATFGFLANGTPSTPTVNRTAG